MIGIFDSGVGGMTVARSIEQNIPNYPLIYLGDIARTPYGPKSDETIVGYSLENTAFLLDQGAKIIVIACNSASSVAPETLRQHFDVPIIEVISPAAQAAVEKTKNKKIGIIGTKATIRSESYTTALKQLDGDVSVFSKACPLLVPLIEEDWTNKRETKMILRRYLRGMKNEQLDTLILGCTHYPLLKPLINARIGKKVTLIDSSEATARYLAGFLAENPIIEPQATHQVERNRYYVTDRTDTAQGVANRIFGREVHLLPSTVLRKCPIQK